MYDFSQYRMYTSRTILNTFFIYFSRILDNPQSRQSAKPFLQSSKLGLPHPVKLKCGRGGGESQFGRGDRHCGSLDLYVLCGTDSLENLPNTFCKKICGTLMSVRAIFYVFSRSRSLPCEHMRNLQNDKSDSGRTHPGTDKIEQCILPLSTRQRTNITRYL